MCAKAQRFAALHFSLSCIIFQEEEEDLPEEPIVPVIRQQDNKARTSKERRISEDVERSRRIAAEVGTLFMCILPQRCGTGTVGTVTF
jgi:hypothetical protein